MVLWHPGDSAEETLEPIRDLDLKSLRLLVAVCELQNMKLAADQEHIEPSAVSKRIAQLEAQLGVRLLARNRRGVQPTPAGEAVLEHARGILYGLGRLRADAARFAGGVRGQVSVAASASAIAQSLLDDLAAFMRLPEHREITVNVDERLSSELVRQVRDGSASVGVCWDAIGFEGLQARPYRRDELVLAVPAGHPLSARGSVAFGDSLAYDHVTLQPSTAVSTMLSRAAAGLGTALRSRAAVSNFDAALRVVAVNGYVSVVPRQVAERAARDGVRVVALTEPWAYRRFGICFRSAEGLSPAAARLVAFLVQAARDRDGD